MLVHFIWLGNKEIPQEYITNINRCININSYTQFKLWRDDTLYPLLEDNKHIEYWSKLTFICKYNFLKYLILGIYPGIYSDLDIYWNKPFSEIIKKINPRADILLSAIDPNNMFLNNSHIELLDDPFIYVKKSELYLDCLEYCKNRPLENLKYNGEYFEKTGEVILRQEEPIGPYGMTEWIKTKNINVDFFYQYGNLDMVHGKFGFHKQINTWNAKN